MNAEVKTATMNRESYSSDNETKTARTKNDEGSRYVSCHMMHSESEQWIT